MTILQWAVLGFTVGVLDRRIEVLVRLGARLPLKGKFPIVFAGWVMISLAFAVAGYLWNL